MGVFSDLDDCSKQQLLDAALAVHIAAKKGIDKMFAPGQPDYEYWVKREGLTRFKRAFKLKAPTVIIPRALVPEEMLGNKQDGPVLAGNGYEMGQLRNIARMLDEVVNVDYGGVAAREVVAVRANRAAGRAAVARPVFPPVVWAAPELAVPPPQGFVDEFNPEDPF